MRAEPLRIRFLIQACTMSLPARPTFMCGPRWRHQHGTLEHSLSSYAKVFGESRYRWRHDQEEPGGVSGLELAVPWEDRLEEAFERKLSVSK